MAEQTRDLREHLIAALLDEEYLWTSEFDATKADAERIATFVLRELGLDDLDAAVERMADVVGEESYGREGDLDIARAALEAALSPLANRSAQDHPG